MCADLFCVSRLHGEKPLAQVNFNRSSQAYDQSLLSKIGKPSSPPRQRSDSTDTMPTTNTLSLQTRDSSSSQRLTADYSASTDSARWMTSPLSGGTSPGLRPNWRDYNMDPRSPSGDSASNLLVLDPELFLQTRNGMRPPTESARSTNDDSISLDSRSQRGSYDQAMFGAEESDFGNDDVGALPHRVRRQESGQGLKRRALSPPTETANPSDFPNKVTGTSGRSPIVSYRPYASYGSVSSISSSARQSSHASSFAPSLAGSSMTSISSYDRPSPSDPSQAQQFITSAGPISSPTATSIGQFRKPYLPPEPTQDCSSIARKMSIKTAVSDTRNSPVTKIGNHYMCDCCPKKPRKFDTEHDLRQVASVLRYTSAYLYSLYS